MFLSRRKARMLSLKARVAGGQSGLCWATLAAMDDCRA